MKKLVTLAALAAILTAGSMTPLFAQGSIFVPAGRTIRCIVFCHGTVVVTTPDGGEQELQAEAAGEADFVSLGPLNDDNDGASRGTAFTPVSLRFTGNDPTFGNYSFKFDGSRPVANTTVIENVPGAEFPATATVYANVIGTIRGLPGEFKNTTPCQIVNTNLQTFNPHVNEQYTFVNDVLFTSEESGHEGSFVIPAGATIILN